MKEIQASGGRHATIKLDDEDYDKIMTLIVPNIYFYINHTKIVHSDGPYSLYVFPKGYNKSRKAITTFLFGLNSSQKVLYADGDILNLQRDNISIVNRLKWSKQKREQEEDEMQDL